jgi:tetratricopeptide (TPR) repeat protein
VICIQNRSELLSAGFSLVSIIAMVRFLKDQARPRSLLPVSLAALALALLTKESAVVVPLVCAALLPFLPGGATARARKGLILMFAIAGTFLSMKFLLFGQGRFEEALPYFSGGWRSSFFTATKSTLIYLSMLALPVNLSLDRGFTIPPATLLPSSLLSSALIALLIVCALRESRLRRGVGFALLFIIVSLLPACNIVFLAGRPISEQRVYFASIGFCLLLAIALEAALRIRRLRLLAMVLVVILSSSYLLISMKRTDCWRDEKVLWERTHEVSPSSWKSELFLAAMYGNEGKYAESIALFKHVLRAPSSQQVRAVKELGVVFEKMGWDDCALREFERAAALDPNFVEGRLCLGDALKKAGRYADAAAHYRFVEQKCPVIGEAQLRLGILYKEQGRYEDALKEFEKLLALYPDNEKALTNIASIYGHEGRDREAEKLFTHIIALNPRSALAHNDYGLYLERRGRHDEAFTHYMSAVRIEPDAVLPHYNLAQAYLQKGEKPAALLELLRAAQVQPGRNDILEEINRLSDALQESRTPGALAGKIVREYGELLNRRGIYLAQIGNATAARDCFKKLVALQPNNGQAHANLGRAYVEEGNCTQALEEFLVAVNQLPAEASVYSSLGSCYASLGRAADARRAWEKALELDPQAKEPRRNLARIRNSE